MRGQISHKHHHKYSRIQVIGEIQSEANNNHQIKLTNKFRVNSLENQNNLFNSHPTVPMEDIQIIAFSLRKNS